MCTVINCDRKLFAKELCQRHYSEVRKYGKVKERNNLDQNEYIVEGTICKILTYDKDQNFITYFLIDTLDLDEVIKYKWYTKKERNNELYVRNNKIGPLHRLLMNAAKGLVVDHIDHNPLNNSRSNLRVCTNQENICNRQLGKNNISGTTGIWWSEQRSRWCLSIVYKNKVFPLGRFKNKEEAIKVRKELEEKYYGEFQYKSNNLEGI